MTDDILLTIGEDGKASLYDDTYDITIHCESKEEQDEVKRVLQNVPHWIPVTERLPDNSRNVLITSKGGVSMAWYNGSYFEKGASTHHRKMKTVTAWCELPESYKEQRHE